jgi:hypothetical protein
MLLRLVLSRVAIRLLESPAMRSLILAAGLVVLASVSTLACKGGEALPSNGGNGGTGTSSSSSGSGGAGGGMAEFEHPWLSDAKILVSGETTNNQDCRTGICRHSENTDLTTFQGAIYLVHRTAMSQILGPNSSLHIYKSTDGGQTFAEQAVIPAPVDRDLRDPHFYTVGGKLYIKALTRLPVTSKRDSDVHTIAVGTSSSDGKTWSDLADIGPETWSLWRIKEQGGVLYSAAYEDGDQAVYLFSSTDGTTWTKGAAVYTVAADTPLETELTFMPSGKLLALVRMDGTDDELLGNYGRLRTKICWSDPPYDKDFTCPDEIMGQRLDGPLSFFHDGRLFVVAREHIGADMRKRTSLFEITGDLDNGGTLAIKSWGRLPSAGDTSYAGQATIDKDRVLVTWYSGNLEKDEAWLGGMLDITDIWQGTIDFSKLK